jgi:hypothetical protein
MSRGGGKRAIERRNLNISTIAVGFNRGRNTKMAIAILYWREDHLVASLNIKAARRSHIGQ